MLIDSHIHIALTGVHPRPQWHMQSIEKKTEWIKDAIKQYKTRGIFAVRDGGDDAFISKLAKEIASSEGFIYKTPVYALHKTGCYGSFLGKAIADTDHFKVAYRDLLSHKPDHLKIILTGIVNFKRYGDVGKTAFTLDELKYMVDSAKYDNLPVMVHANGREGVAYAISARVNTIEHGYLISEPEMYGMAEHDIVWIPTLSPLGNILSSNDENFVMERDTIQKVYNLHAENILKAYQMGVKIALGSDAGAYGVYHGSGLLDEVAHFERIGFSKQQIEKMSFENGAKALQLSNQEIAEVRKYASDFTSGIPE